MTEALAAYFGGLRAAPLTMMTETPVVVLFCLGSALLKCCFSLPVTSACMLFSWEASSCTKEQHHIQSFLTLTTKLSFL